MKVNDREGVAKVREGEWLAVRDGDTVCDFECDRDRDGDTVAVRVAVGMGVYVRVRVCECVGTGVYEPVMVYVIDEAVSVGGGDAVMVEGVGVRTGVRVGDFVVDVERDTEREMVTARVGDG